MSGATNLRSPHVRTQMVRAGCYIVEGTKLTIEHKPPLPGRRLNGDWYVLRNNHLILKTSGKAECISAIQTILNEFYGAAGRGL